MALSATYFHVFRPSCIIASPLAPRYAFNDPPTNNLPSHAPYLNTRQSRLISLPGSVLTTPPYSTRIGDLNASTRQPLNASMPSKPQQRQQCNAAAAPQRLNTPTPQSFNNYPTTLILTTSTLQQVSASTIPTMQRRRNNSTYRCERLKASISGPDTQVFNPQRPTGSMPQAHIKASNLAREHAHASACACTSTVTMTTTTRHLQTTTVLLCVLY